MADVPGGIVEGSAATATTPTGGSTRFRPAYREYVLFMMTLVFALQYLHRQIIVVLAEPIKHSFSLSDSQLGLMTGFVASIPYSLMLLPGGMLVDRWNRRTLLVLMLGLWSLITLLTGFAQTLPQLIVAVVVFSAICATNCPAAMSLLADLYDRRTRATVMGIYFSGPAIATILGFTALGAIAEHWGWRTAFFAAGVPGIVVAFLLLGTVREPTREASGTGSVPSLLYTARFLSSQRSALHLMLGMTISSTATSGHIAWMFPWLMRVHDLNLVSTATAISIAYGVFLTLGQVSGGALVDRLAKRNVAWIGRSTAICATLAGLAMIAATLSTTTWVAIAFLACAALPSGCLFGPVMGSLQSLVSPRMRGVTNALMSTMIIFIGSGFGPLLAGSLSDVFTQFAGNRSIAFALAALALLQFWAAIHFFTSTRSIRGDIERADKEAAKS